MAVDPTTLERLSAYVDGELAPEARAELEKRLAAEPALQAEVRAMRATGDAMRRAADDWEKDVDFDGFYEKVAARIETRPSPRSSLAARLAGKLAEWSRAHRPAVAAAAATLLVLVGGGSLFLMRIEAPRPLSLKGGPAVIETLSVDEASAVVYRTKSNNTVIWLTEDKGT